MSEHPQYIIKTPADFLTIPQEKLEHALKDFHNWIETHHALRSLAKEIPALVGLEADVSEFRWVDDGKHDMIPVFEIKEPAKDQPND
jgi:hypothetical protein